MILLFIIVLSKTGFSVFFSDTVSTVFKPENSKPDTGFGISGSIYLQNPCFIRIFSIALSKTEFSGYFGYRFYRVQNGKFKIGHQIRNQQVDLPQNPCFIRLVIIALSKTGFSGYFGYRFYRVQTGKFKIEHQIRNQRVDLPRNPYFIRLFIIVLSKNRIFQFFRIPFLPCSKWEIKILTPDSDSAGRFTPKSLFRMFLSLF